MATSPEYGYPTPGVQEVSVDEIMASLYFVNADEWNQDRVAGDFDYVVIGSSFCSLSFVHKILENTPNAKIFVIDRGSYFHPEHFQNLPPAYSLTVGGKSETFHWKITDDTHNGEYIKYQHGMNNFFGGRSPFWSAWCPEPTDDEMAEWPAETIQKVHEYFPKAQQLLNVVSANNISPSGSGQIFGELQDQVYDAVKTTPDDIASVTRVIHAPLAVRADMYRNEDYSKYSANGPFLNLLITKNYESSTNNTPRTLKCVLKCLVKKIRHDNRRATVLETNMGDFTLGTAKLILAMGTLPPTTLMLNSFPTADFPGLSNIGQRFTSHFISSIIARVPITSAIPIYSQLVHKGKLQMAAIYVAGEDTTTKMQYHIQLTAVIDETPIANIYDTMRHLPDVVAAPSLEQLMTSRDGYVLFVCACLGQMDHNNADNWFVLNEDEDITCNATLQAVANDNDNALWDVMDDSTFQVLENYLTPAGAEIDYWSPNLKNWNGTTRPEKAERRVPGLVHEASTMWLGEDGSGAPVDLNYKFRDVDNVYLTGGALWPTGASWNPTCAMSALAMDLADKLSPPSQTKK